VQHPAAGRDLAAGQLNRLVGYVFTEIATASCSAMNPAAATT
jgi:hypothetical protein